MKILVGFVFLLLSAQSLAATCKISEYSNMLVDESSRVVPVALEPSVRQAVTYTATSGQSAAFATATRFVRIICDAKAHFRFSTAGTDAVATDPYLPADTAEYFGVPPGGAYIVDFNTG